MMCGLDFDLSGAPAMLFEWSELLQENGVVVVLSGVVFLSLIMILVLAEVGQMGKKGRLFALLTRVGVCSQGIHCQNQMI
jgi:hypothetical protein